MTIVSDNNQEIVTEVYISTDLLDLPDDTISLYALDAKTIGLSNNPPAIWQEHRLFETRAQVLKDEAEQELTILLPPEIVRFYRPKKIELAGAPEKDNVLLVIHQS